MQNLSGKVLFNIRRLLASLIDIGLFVPFTIYIYNILFPFDLLAHTYFSTEFYALIVYFLILSALETILGFTIGKFLMRLKVVKLDNSFEKPTFIQNFLRQFTKLFIVFFIISMLSDKSLTESDYVFIYFLIATVTLIFTVPDHGRNLMDKLTKTKVVALNNQ